MSTDPPPPTPPGPPGPWAGPPPGTPQRPPGLSNTARFWIGVPIGGVGLPALAVAVLFVGGILSSASDRGSAVVVTGLALLGVVLVVVGLVVRATRWFVLGALAGAAVVAIVLAGACVALIQAMGG